MMYNLTVDTAHTYFVGDGQWLVHNDCAGSIDQALARLRLTTNNIKEHLTDEDLEAAMNDLKGQYLVKPNGSLWRHDIEVKEAQNGLKNVIDEAQRLMGNSETTEDQFSEAREIISEASQLLDNSEGFFP